VPDYSCVPVEVAVFADRAHVECAAPAPKTRGSYPVDTGHSIVYFSVSKSDSDWAGRFVHVANLAMASGLPMIIRYRSGDYSGEAHGCVRSDCRTPEAFSLRRTTRLP
jgi:hypothetical protein